MEKGLYCPECVKAAAHGVKRPWYRVRIYQTMLALLFMFAIHLGLLRVGVTVFQGFWYSFYEYSLMIWWAVLLGFVLGGIIDYAVPNEYISKFLSSPKKRTIGWSVLLGFLMSSCSHGILAIAIELYRKGASVPAVIGFLLASPWANLPITILLFSFFGFNAIFMIGSAIAIAIITGLAFQALDRKGWIERSKHTAHVSKDFSVKKDIRRRWKSYRKNPSATHVVFGVASGGWKLAKMVLWWILIGVALASAARVVVPHEIFAAYMGPTLIGLFVTLALATVIEVCSEGSSPMAFEIYRQTGAFGNSLTFLMAGVATDYTEVGLIASNIGRKAAFWLPLITVPQILLLGYIFNLLA